jgi:hypothetical protein
MGSADEKKAVATPAATPASSTDWPTYRHDAGLTGISPLKGGFAQAPTVAWSLNLGGPRQASEQISLRDVTGDGHDELLTVGAETVTCRNALGTVMWKLEGYPSPAIVDVRDYAGDGSLGILLSTYLAGRNETFMVSGRTGKAVSLWVYENNFGGSLRFGKLLPAVKGQQVAATASGAPAGAAWGGQVWLISFANGLEKPRWNVRQKPVGILYAPKILFADLDADGQAEMVIVSHEEIWTFDTQTGVQKFHAQYSPNIRTYMGTIAAIKLSPQDKHLSLAMINPSIPGLKGVRTDGKTEAKQAWKVVTGKEDQYQGLVQIVPGGTDVVYDLDGDGQYEMVASITNEHNDNKTRLVVFSAKDGKRLTEEDNLKVVSVDDLDGDGKPEVVLQEQNGFRIARWTGSGFADVWKKAGFEPLVEALPSEGDPSRTSGGNPKVRRATAGSKEFVCRFADGDWNCRLATAGLERVAKFVPPTAPPAVAAASSSSFPDVPGDRPSDAVMSYDATGIVSRIKGRDVFHYVTTAPQTYLAPPPLVADLAGGRKIVVRQSEGKFLQVSPSGKLEKVLIERPHEKFQTHVDGAGAGPTICDMDGDGKNDIVATVSDKDGTPFCGIFDENGQLQRRIDLLPGTKNLNRGPTGSLGAGRGRWIILRMFYGEGSYQGKYPVVVAFNGKTGQQLWVRDHYSHYGTNPVIFAAHFPTAVLDYDRDGTDDWVACSENFYGIISVKDNRDLVPSVVLSSAAPGHWTAYTYPSIVTLPKTNERLLFHHGAYAMALVTNLEGQARWHVGMTRDTGSGHGIGADLNGDGEPEFLHPQADGLIRCFALNAGAGKCESCPPEEKLDAHNHGGVERWHYAMKRPVSRMLAADLDGDGKLDVLFGGSDGKLHALSERDGKPQLLWSIDLGRRVGDPILADLNGDGRGEILVPVEDGKLYCLEGPDH